MKMRKSHVFVLVTLLLLLVAALTVTAQATGKFVPNPTDSTILIRYEDDGTEDIVIPDTFKTVGAQAFIGNTSIKSVVIPDSVTSMGADAFANCTNLQFATLSSKLDGIPARAFKNCSSLLWIIMPRSVMSIGDEAFYGCVNMIDVMGPDPAIQGSLTFYPVSAYVTGIGTNVFSNCPKAVVQCFKGSAMETYLNNNPSVQKTVVDPIVYGIKATRSPFVIIWDPSNSAQVQLSVTVDPSFVSTDVLGYSVGDSSIVKVSDTGLLTPQKPGTCMSTVYEQKNVDTYVEIPIVVLDDRQGWQQWTWTKPGGEKVTSWFYCKSRTEFAVGWQMIGGAWYHFNDAGIMETGWIQDGAVWYYLNANGAMVTGWLNLPANSNTWFYLSGNGAMYTGWLKLNGKWFYLAPVAANGFVTGQMYYGGSYNIGGTNYLFDNNGVLISDSGWQKVDGIWYYYHGATLHKGWLLDNKKWYYMDTTTGAMQIGWINDGGTWYYLSGSGAMVTGWQKIDGLWYYFKDSGAMATGWLKWKNDWYFLDKTGDVTGIKGAMVENGWVSDGYWYFMRAGGAMATGWVKLGDDWFYFNPSGAMLASSWLQQGNTWYYLLEDGVMATGTVVIGGVTYNFAANGAWIP